MAHLNVRVTGAATTQIVAAVSGKQIKVFYCEFTVSAAATVSVHEGTDGTTTRFIDGDFAANSGVVVGGLCNAREQVPVFVLTGNTALNVTNSAGNIKIVVDYAQE